MFSEVYVNMIPFYIRDLSIYGFWYPQGSWNQPPMDTEGGPYLFLEGLNQLCFI